MMTSMAAERPLLDPLQQLDAVELGHFQVGDDDVEGSVLQLLPGLSAVGGGDDFVALGAEVVGQGDAFDLLVVDDEDFHGGGDKGLLRIATSGCATKPRG